MKKNRRIPLSVPVLVTGLLLAGCASSSATPAATPSPRVAAAPGQAPGGGQRPPGAQAPRTGPKPYAEVITAKAVTRRGMFTTHIQDEKLFFEIPRRELMKEMLLITRPVETTQQTGFFGGGGSTVVLWERDGDHIILRERTYTVTADSGSTIRLAVAGMAKGPVVGRFAVESWGPDSAAVIEVTALYTTTNTDMSSLQNVQRDRSWIEKVVPSERNVEVEATQTGSVRAPGAPPTAPSQTVTARLHWSMMRLPEQAMMPRLHDKRVGFNSFTTLDYSRGEHRAVERRYIRRFRLEKKTPGAALSDPVEPIVYWIDAATPEWLKPWIKKGVDAWQVAFREAGFTNAIEGRYAPSPEEDPDWSNYALGTSIIYWRPSTIPNATGGQVVDPRTGEILKGEVNMYHNVMNLLRNWYFIQVSPLDPRGRTLSLPDSLMGRLVEYVVTHEVGHSIGFPHNMKASYAYHPDSLRSAAFLRRMGGHVPTLMDYSRFNYVAQPEDNIPVDLLVPQVGPYDKYAVQWGYGVIPGARTPDEEWPVLDRLSRIQDTVPWLRWTTADSPNDPGNLTEAVGDQNAVYSSTLALRNLRRVMASLIPVAERPGEDYTQLEELYTNAVQQWGRYMGHVAAVIGGADTQEKYGTGPRFTPVSRARQQAAMRFLTENAFATPAYFVEPAILGRIEAAGVLDRLRQAQGTVVQNLISKDRLDRLVEYEALAGSATRAYTVADLMGELRSAVWSELSGTRVAVDVYRRNLQRAYLEAVDRELNPPARPATPQGGGPFGGGQPPRPRFESDTRPVLRGELRELDQLAETALNRAADGMTRMHLRDIRHEIDRILNPKS